MLNRILQRIYDWSEVWSLLLPLGILFFRPRQPAYLRAVVVYLWVALPINLICDIIGDFNTHLPQWMQSNTALYNLHSVVRFACFAAFFAALRQPYFQGIKRWLPIVTALFLLVNFGFFENFLNPDGLSGNLLTVEAYLLLVYCLLYYLAQLRDDVAVLAGTPDFWVTTGLCIYVVTNFFVFLFYTPLLALDGGRLADKMWSVHNLAYILMTVFIAKAFYESPRPEPRI